MSINLFDCKMFDSRRMSLMKYQFAKRWKYTWSVKYLELDIFLCSVFRTVELYDRQFCYGLIIWSVTETTLEGQPILTCFIHTLCGLNWVPSIKKNENSLPRNGRIKFIIILGFFLIHFPFLFFFFLIWIYWPHFFLSALNNWNQNTIFCQFLSVCSGE